MSDNPLINHPPRLCDLTGEPLKRALAQRHADHKARWLHDRQPGSLWQRIFG